MINATTISLLLLLPFFAFVALGLGGKKLLGKAAGIFGTLLMAAAASIAFVVAYEYFFVVGKVEGVYQTITPVDFTWLSFSDKLSINFGLLIDPISVMMLVVVTLVSLMVHVFSLGYMKGEERLATYFSQLSLFTFSMLGLVLSTNIFQIYMFWELVGLSSFLLIGFYYDRPSAVAASKKAFIVTRFADLGFLIGILTLSFYAQTLDFNKIIYHLTSTDSSMYKSAIAGSFIGVSALTWALALIFIGGAGKSAMFPLHIWLPDAMEGPTPVSALIHAATMVVAGVYLVARLFPVFSMSPAVMELITFVGVFSALFAAIIACTQTDIKRVLAYSTMSQIGFMMFSLGISGYGGEAGLGYTASMFHLFTHAMFKALLFLSAGSVIHFVHSNEMGDMGGLKKYMPITHLCFLVGCMAIAGVPLLSGFFSKEEILLAAYQQKPVVYWLALITSGITAFYMFRLYFRIFWSRPYHPHTNANHGEGGWVILFPLMVLGIAAVFAGYIPFGNLVSTDHKPLETSFHLVFSIAPVLAGLGGILLAYWLYYKENERPNAIARSLRGIYVAAAGKFYVDEIYLFVTRKILFNLVGRPAAWFDRNIIDGLVNATGNTTQWIAKSIKGFQSGKVQEYALYFLVGVIVLLFLFLYMIK